MKKKKKTILIIAIAAVVVIGAAVAIILATKTTSAELGGTALVEGTGEYTWKKYNVDIGMNDPVSDTNYYTNRSGDYIWSFHYYTDSDDDDNEAWIYFESYHHVADDLWVIVVLSDGTNTFTSPAFISHLPIGGHGGRIVYENGNKNYYRIKELWVMTED